MEQKKFAEAIGATDKIVSKWRTAGLMSYRKYLPQIAEVLNTSVEYLLTGKQKEPTVTDDGLTQAELALIDLFRRLTPEQQDMVIRMVQAAADKQ